MPNENLQHSFYGKISQLILMKCSMLSQRVGLIKLVPLFKGESPRKSCNSTANVEGLHLAPNVRLVHDSGTGPLKLSYLCFVSVVPYL